MTKLISENKTNWDEHLFVMLFSYKIAYKVAIGYTPYQLVYGLHPLIPIKYIILVDGVDERVLISKIIKLEKLQEDRM